MADDITIPRPQITTGPQHLSVDEATVKYLREVAERVRTKRYWGSGVTDLVTSLLDAAAAAITADALAPEPIAYLCKHGRGEPEVLRPGYQCSEGGDDPIYPGDTVVTRRVFHDVEPRGLGIVEVMAEVERARTGQ